MLKKFLSLCFIIAVGASLFFLNMNINSELKSFTTSDIILGKFLNESTSILLLGYLIINFWKYHNKKIYLLSVIFITEISSEFIYYFVSIENNRWIFEDSLIIIERIIYCYIFVLKGSKLISQNLLNNLLNGFICLLVPIFYYFQIKQNDVYWFTVAMLFLLLFFCILGINTKNKLLHPITFGVLFILISDLIFMYAQFHNTFYQYLYLAPRIFACMGELLITYAILKKYETSYWK